MKKVYILLMLFLVSCGDSSKTKEDAVISEKLDSILVKGVLDIVATETENCNIPLNEALVAITFIVEPDYASIYFSDSIVYITYNVFHRKDTANIMNYKGVLDIDGINVAIFDKGNFGEQYYNIDSLKQISLNNFKEYNPNNVFISLLYYLENGKLNYWNP